MTFRDLCKELVIRFYNEYSKYYSVCIWETSITAEFVSVLFDPYKGIIRLHLYDTNLFFSKPLMFIFDTRNKKVIVHTDKSNQIYGLDDQVLNIELPQLKPSYINKFSIPTDYVKYFHDLFELVKYKSEMEAYLHGY